jgi:pyruvate dehydrogenase E2 component (dihydrolipoamide acetyltransferase)
MREIVMPKSSMTMTEGELTKWLLPDGDAVSEGDVVAEILTDKVEMEVEAPSSGTLSILVGEGSTVAVGTPIAVVLAEGEEKPGSAAAAGASPASAPEAGPRGSGAAAGASPASAPEAGPRGSGAAAGGAAPTGSTPTPSRPPEAAPSSPGRQLSSPRGAAISEGAGEASGGGGDGKLRASPAARAMARRVGVDIALVRGSGPRGRIKSVDVAAFAEHRESRPESVGAGLEVRSRERPRGIRGAMARHMAGAASIPQFTLFTDVTLGSADAARRDHEGISLTDVILRASALALRQYPEMNAHFMDGEIVRYISINIGLATDTPQGLVVPVIKGADGNLASIAAKRKELAEAARIGRLRPDEIEGGTFTVSNLGMYGIDVFQAVIDPPRVGILSVGRMRGDAGRTATLGLTADHRAVDGAQGARFLQTLKTLLERPDRYLM